MHPPWLHFNTDMSLLIILYTKALRDEIAELQSVASDLADMRNGLVKANPDCDSSDLDDSLNKMNKQLMDCNNKLSDRQGKLEEALVQCGQFSDAVGSILQWLEETQALIDGQGLISAADPNILKAQIMEQKVPILSSFIQFPIVACLFISCIYPFMLFIHLLALSVLSFVQRLIRLI